MEHPAGPLMGSFLQEFTKRGDVPLGGVDQDPLLLHPWDFIKVLTALVTIGVIGRFNCLRPQC